MIRWGWSKMLIILWWGTRWHIAPKLLSYSGPWTAFFHIHITGNREGGSIDTIMERVNVPPHILQSIKYQVDVFVSLHYVNLATLQLETQSFCVPQYLLCHSKSMQQWRRSETVKGRRTACASILDSQFQAVESLIAYRKLWPCTDQWILQMPHVTQPTLSNTQIEASLSFHLVGVCQWTP